MIQICMDSAALIYMEQIDTKWAPNKEQCPNDANNNGTPKKFAILCSTEGKRNKKKFSNPEAVAEIKSQKKALPTPTPNKACCEMMLL